MAVEYKTNHPKAFQALPPGTQNALQAIHADTITLEILFILKNHSSQDNPLGREQINELLYSPISKRNLSRKLDGLKYIFEIGEKYPSALDLPAAQCNYTKEDDIIDEGWCYCIAALLRGCLGGTMKTNQKSEKSHKTYYFEPLLDNSWLDMITNSLIANQYLSDGERSYIINVLATLNSVTKNHFPMAIPTEEVIDFANLCEYIPSRQEATLPQETFQLLKNLNTIYCAIIGGYQISIVYGSYQKKSGSKLPALLPKSEKCHILNPYVLLTNGDHQYLIATYDGYEEPLHYRVDRICSVEIVKDPEDATKYHARAPRPNTLRDFFHNNQFQKDQYIQAHPLMSIYEDAKRTGCTLQCSDNGLGVIVDTFGQDMVSIIRCDKTNTETTYQVRVTAEYNGIVLFCQQQCRIITALSPLELVQDVTSELQKALTRYEHLLT